MSLTDTACKNAKPGQPPPKKHSNGGTKRRKDGPQPYKMFDGGGLYLLVQLNGAKLWRLAYRFAGKQKALALGAYPAVSLAKAREGREAAKKLLADGVDPSVRKRRDKLDAKVSANATLRTVAIEWLNNQRHAITPKYADELLRRLEANIFPRLGVRPVADIDAPELLQVLRKVERRGAEEQARRLRQTLGAVFRYAIVTGRATHDPTAALKGALRAKGRQRHHTQMPRDDLPSFLRSVDTYDGAPRTAIGLRLILLTLARTGELRAARWSEFEHLEGAEPLWRVPAARMKMKTEHLVPLQPQAVAALRELRALPGANGSPFLFPSTGREGFMSNNCLLYAVYRLGWHSRATTHGFRGLASTVLNEAGFNRDWIERALAHDERDEVRGAYNAAEYLAGRRSMLRWWADWLDEVKASGKAIVLARDVAA